MADPNILRGAVLAAEARRRGISEDQMIDLMLAAEREIGDIPAELPGIRQISNRQVEYGEQGNQDRLQMFVNADEQAKAEGRRDPNEFRKFERVKNADGKVEVRERQIVLGENQPLRDEQLREQEKLRDFGLRVQMEKDKRGNYVEKVMPFRDQIAPVAQVVEPIRADLQMGINKYGADAFGSFTAPQRGVLPDDQGGGTYIPEKFGIAEAVGRLEDIKAPNRQAEQALVRDMVRADREGFSTEEIKRRARAQAGREINIDTSGKAAAPVLGEVRKRANARDVGVKGQAVRANDGEDVAIRLHGINANPADPSAVRAAREQQLMAELRGGQNPIAQMRNDARAAIEADNIAYALFANDQRGGARADRDIANIGVINQLGHAKYGNDFAVDNNPGDFGAYPNELPIDLGRDYNAPVTDNRFAGPLQKQQQFIVDNAPGYREGGAFGDFPQVGINEQLDAARAALGQAKFKGQGVNLDGVQIRNLDELQAAAGMVAGLAKEKGQAMFERVDGKNVPIENPGIRAALERGGMNAREVGNVAAAMFQIEAARRNPLNEAKKELFGVGLGQPDRSVEFGGNHPALGGGNAKIAMVRGEKVGGKEIRAQLQALDGKRGNPGSPLNQDELAQARMPFIGATAENGAPRAKFVKGAARMMNKEALVANYGTENAAIAEELIQRREQQAGVGADGFGLRRPNVVEGGAAFVDIPSNFVPKAQREAADLGAASMGTRPGTMPQAPITNVSGGGGRGYMTSPDGPGDQPRRDRYIDSIVGGVRNAPKNFRRAPAKYQAAAAAGGALLGAVGLDALVKDETERRGQY